MIGDTLFNFEPIEKPAMLRAGVAGTIPLCSDCGKVHSGADTTAVGRFNPAGPAGYMARLPGAAVRATRAEALQDVCSAWRRAA